jgi:hypothetical protein
MSNLIRGAVVAAVLGVAAIGCRAATDLNTTCTLIRGLPDGGSEALTERFVQEKTGTTKDFVSFGSVECDDLVCVRDATFPRSTNLDGVAFGYCSRPCVQGCTCPSQDAALDDKKDTQLNCRPLLLDEQTLNALCTDQPSACVDLGGVRSPFFCARGENLDAGT